MKRIIALILTVVLCLSFCSCEKNLKPRDLIDTEWYGVLNHTIYGSSYLKFEKDGTGSYVYYENNNSIEEFTYTIAENTIEIITTEQDPFGSIAKSKHYLEFVEDENYIQLKQINSNVIFVPKENFAEATNNLKLKLISEATVLDWEVATDLRLENEVKFNNEYIGKTFKYTAKVYEINERYCTVANETYQGLPCNSIDVYLSSSDLTKLEKYSTITVVGKLSSYSTSGRMSNAFLVK